MAGGGGGGGRGAQSNFPTRDHQNIFNLILTYIYINGVGSAGGGGGGGQWYICAPPPPPTHTHTLLTPYFYFPLELCLYNTDKQLFGIFHIPINYLVDNFIKLIQMAVIK